MVIESTNIFLFLIIAILDYIFKKKVAFFEYIKLDRDKSTFKSHRDFSSEKEITFKHL